jgi:hypothetical protein
MAYTENKNAASTCSPHSLAFLWSSRLLALLARLHRTLTKNVDPTFSARDFVP